MKHCTSALKTFIFILFTILLSQTGYSQLPAISLQITATPESCTANGTLTFAVANASSGSTINYVIYKQPNTTTPIATVNSTQFGGLTAGNYLVIANQSLGNQSNSATQNATVTNTISNLVYQLSGAITCTDGQLIVNVTSGNAVQYEIISGPVIRPLQNSNIFTQLPAGEYVVRVIDACGDGVVQTYTLQNPTQEFDLGSVVIPSCELPACNTIAVSNTLIAVSGFITYPVVATYTVYPPTGAPIVTTQSIPSGSSGSNEFLANLPFYHNQSYSYDLQVTDQCGNVSSSLANTINEHLELILKQSNTNCAANIEINACNYVGPFTVQFLSAPAGFNALTFNVGHPGPFGSLPIKYESTQANVMPIGNYTVQITDGCGRTSQSTIQVEESVEPDYTVLPQDCGFGQVTMPAEGGSPVVAVTITSAPAAYNQTLPQNVSSFITDGQFLMSQLPAGTYVFTVVSLCLETYEYTVTIPAVSSNPVLVSYIRGCETGYTSLSLAVQNATVTSVIIQAAPANLGQPLPYDVSFNIADGALYMNGLPQGSYTILLTDSCSGARTFTIGLPGYAVTQDSVEIDANCGSYNIVLNYTSNQSANYWLQKWNPFANQWEHPLTGVAYLPGTDPEPLNSLFLANQQTTFNIASTGNFRVVRAHKIFSNGSADLFVCLQTIKEFTFTGAPSITDAFALPCQTTNGDIVVVAEGLAPLQYFITSQNGQAFYVDNGNNSVFEGLTPGIYNFQVRDICGNIVNRLFDFGSIPNLSISQGVLCNGQNGQLSVPQFSFLNYQWWQGNNTSNILSTSNVLNFTPFNSALQTGTFYVRVYSNQAGLCADQILSYTIPQSGNNPQAGNDGNLSICGSSATVNLFSLLSGTFSQNGQWTETTNSGMLIGNSWLPLGIPYGTYQFKYSVAGLCGATDEALVTINYNAIPGAPLVLADSPICTSETIELSATGPAGATYQWSGPNGFLSNEQNPRIALATAQASGSYSVTASLGDCISVPSSINVVVNAAPDFELAAGCNGNNYKVTASSNNPGAGSWQYSWSGPNNYTANVNAIDISGGEKGNYELTVTTPDGCLLTKNIEIVNTLCAIPSGISPNGDGDNDVFDLTGFDAEQFKIYNRYGRLVFEQDNYTNEWHGQDYKDRELPDATYYYYVRLKSGEERTGWVYVIHKV